MAFFESTFHFCFLPHRLYLFSLSLITMGSNGFFESTLLSSAFSLFFSPSIALSFLLYISSSFSLSARNHLSRHLDHEDGCDPPGPAPSSSRPSDCERSKVKEMATQRAKQLQEEEEEHTREQKAKALAKLEELNIRTSAESSNQKVNYPPPSSNDVLNKQQDSGAAVVFKADMALPGAPLGTCSEAVTPTDDDGTRNAGNLINASSDVAGKHSDSAVQTSDLSQNQHLEPSQDTGSKKVMHETAPDIHDTSSKHEQLGYGRRQTIPQDRSMGEKQASTMSTGNPDYTGEVAMNTSTSDALANNEENSVRHRKKNNKKIMHKATNKYEVGKVSDKEEAKQRQLKFILDKLMPQNFEKLCLQVKEVNIDNTVTLSWFVSQIFDKALTEPTFCEIYANFCSHLSNELPDFNEDNERITFKRLLVNKCQEEFERGEREEAEANRAEEEGEIKQTEAEREEKRTRARRRMPGSIRLIGELYKKRMLSEGIMHRCIQKLLGEYENPDEEDLEDLCELMITIGEMIDHPKVKVYMDGYFDRMLKLSTNQKLSYLLRFMLRDAIDLRKNKWQQRRKIEGPKKIDEVHRDAAQERQAQASRLSRGPVISSAPRCGPPADYRSRSNIVLPSLSSQQINSIRGMPGQVRGHATQDVRMDERHQFESRVLSIPLPQGSTDDSITLGTHGGLARGMSIRGQPLMSNAPSADIPPNLGYPRRLASGSNSYNFMSREDSMPRYMQDKFSSAQYDQPSPYGRSSFICSRDPCFPDNATEKSSVTTIPGRTHASSGILPAPSETKQLSEESLREKSISAIREFYSAKDEEEVALCIKKLKSPTFYPSMVSLWVTDSFERKDKERDLLAMLLVNLCKSRDNLLRQNQLIQGFVSVLSTLEDAVNDAPRAAEFLGHIFAKVTLEHVVPLTEIARLIHEGGEEPGSLVETGLASEVLGSILQFIRTEKGDSVLSEIRTSSRLRLEDFRPPHSTRSNKLDPFL